MCPQTPSDSFQLAPFVYTHNLQRIDSLYHIIYKTHSNSLRNHQQTTIPINTKTHFKGDTAPNTKHQHHTMRPLNDDQQHKDRRPTNKGISDRFWKYSQYLTDPVKSLFCRRVKDKLIPRKVSMNQMFDGISDAVKEGIRCCQRGHQMLSKRI